MKRKVAKLLSIALLSSLLMSNVVFAAEPVKEDLKKTSNEETTIQPRSLYLASGISEITNEGSGVLHIYADFTSYNPVPWAKLTIKLERKKSADSGSWTKVATYTKEFKAEDEPDGRLTFGSYEKDVSGFATNYYYRLTCEHKVKTPSGSYETKTSRTDGVLLTPYPDARSID